MSVRNQIPTYCKTFGNLSVNAYEVLILTNHPGLRQTHQRFNVTQGILLGQWRTEYAWVRGNARPYHEETAPQSTDRVTTCRLHRADMMCDANVKNI